MIPYIIFILVVIFAYRLKKPIWMAVIITFFSVIRFDTGWDYDSYYQVCIDNNALETAKIIWGGIWAKWFEYVNLHRIPFIGIGIPAVLTTIIVYYALYLLHEKDKKQIADSLLVYSLWPFLYLYSFCTVRQSLAISIVLLIVVLVSKKRFVLGGLLFVLNYFLHPSSIFTIVFLPFILVKKRLSVGMILGGTVLVGAFFGFASFLLESLGLSNYLGLLESTDSFGGKIAIVYAALSIYLIYVVVHNKDVTSLYSKMTSIVAMGAILQFLVYITDVPSVISRACSYTYIFMAPTLFYTFRQIRFKEGKNLAIVIMALFFLVYLYVTQDSPDAASQYVPYKTIFSQL